MITIVDGDLFLSETQTLVNTINCVGIMGKGIALEFKKRYPEMFIKYQDVCSKGLIRPGKLWLYKSLDKWVLNFPTKDHWRNKSEVEFLISGLQKFLDTYENKGITSISFPLLGASNGGLDPSLSLDLMIKYLSECKIPVFIYKN
jgi:O-acetyl-ADP-ribose deacetylase (regulator of RNase III)